MYRPGIVFYLFAVVIGLGAVTGVSGAKQADFTLPDLEGKTRTLSEFRGKWVVVNYWATWCPPCLDELPELEMFHTAHKDRDAVVIGINLEQIAIEKLKQFVDEQFVSYPILIKKPGVVTELGRVTGLPTSYLINPEGVAVAKQVGPVNREMLEAYMEKHNNNQGHR